MYLGIVVFGSLLSEVQNACEDMYHLLRNRSRLMLEVRQFLRDVSVPQVRPFVHACVRACVRACIHVLTRPHRTQHLLQKVMVWLDFDYSSRQRKMQEQSILEHVSAHSLTHAHTRVLFLALSLSLPHPLVLSPFPLSFTRLRWCCVTSHLLSHFTNAPSVAAAAVHTHSKNSNRFRSFCGVPSPRTCIPICSCAYPVFSQFPGKSFHTYTKRYAHGRLNADQMLRVFYRRVKLKGLRTRKEKRVGSGTGLRVCTHICGTQARGTHVHAHACAPCGRPMLTKTCVRAQTYTHTHSFYRYELMIDLYSTMNPVTFPKVFACSCGCTCFRNTVIWCRRNGSCCRQR